MPNKKIDATINQHSELKKIDDTLKKLKLQREHMEKN